MGKETIEISKDEFLSYEIVRLSGITNMWDVRFVSELTGLKRDKILFIMDNYSGLKDKYLT